MKEKALTLLTCIFISLSILGFVYAQWNDIIIVSTTMRFGDLNMGFTKQEPPTCTEYHIDPVTGQLVHGEYLDKDVGKTECYYTVPKEDGETGKEAYAMLVITITNAYPSYEVHCNFTLENIGLLPLHINETIISDRSGVLSWDPVQGALVDATGKQVLRIVITPEVVCNRLEPEDDLATPWLDNKAEFEMAIHVTENAEESKQYTFQVEISYEVT